MEDSKRLSQSSRKVSAGSPPRRSRFSLNFSTLRKDSRRDNSFDDVLKKSVACLSPKSGRKVSNNTPTSPRKKVDTELGELTLKLLAEHATDKRVHSIIQRFAFGLGPDGLSLLSMVEFIGAYKAWLKKPTVDGAEVIVKTYLACDAEVESGKICKRGLYTLSGSKVLQKVCNAFREVSEKMYTKVSGNLKDPNAAQKLCDELNRDVDSTLFNKVFFEVYCRVGRQHFSGEGNINLYLPDSAVAAPLMRLFQPDEKKQFVEESEAVELYDQLQVKVLRNSVDPQKSALSEVDLTALAINGMVNHLVIVPPGIRCSKHFVARKSDQIARLVMAHAKEGRDEIYRLERSLVKIEEFREEKRATAKSLERLEQLIHYALYRLTTGQCSKNRGSDLSTLALPEPSKQMIAWVEREVALRVDAARLGRHAFTREITSKEWETFASMKEENRWRHLVSDGDLNFPGEFRINGKPLPTTSLKAFKKQLAAQVGNDLACKTAVGATSISALVLFGGELENKVCPALWNTKGELRKKQDGAVTDYDIFIGEDGAIEAVTTVTYGVDWWPKTNEIKPQVASFQLRLAFHLNPSNMKLERLTITPSNLTFSNAAVPYKLRLQVLEALQGIRSEKVKR